MPYASEGIAPIGGVSQVGLGQLPLDPWGHTMGTASAAAIPLASLGIVPEGNFRPKLNIEVARQLFQKFSERAPGLSTAFGNIFLHLGGYRGNSNASESTRKSNIPTAFERVEFISGLPGPAIGLPIPTMQSWEKAPSWAIGPVEDGNFDIYASRGEGPAEIINEPKSGLKDNISDQVQDFMTNEHEQLAVFRTSFPNVPVKQAPTTNRSLVLNQVANVGNYQGEMNIPDGSVTCRITWTRMDQNDLWVSFSSQASIPQLANQPGTPSNTGVVSGQITQASPTNDGSFLNPDATKDFLIKGKRAISFECENLCIVSVQFYMQA